MTWYGDSGHGACRQSSTKNQSLAAISPVWWTSSNPNNDPLPEQTGFPPPRQAGPRQRFRRHMEIVHECRSWVGVDPAALTQYDLIGCKTAGDHAGSIRCGNIGADEQQFPQRCWVR
ncbi:hypothetical protein GCM10022267_83620 [Lentzea roselyniae]|uniref:Uncharacterized protein n=1 Tax=Lentzea roselyniae TaxID=531940 RepID=A0ABP7CDV7_9PSEU